MDTERGDLAARLGADDWRTVLEAVDGAADQLRVGTLAEQAAMRLLALAGHPKWEVRKAVAHALLHLDHDGVDAAIARLAADDNAWVREAARQTVRRRAEPGEEPTDVAGLLARLEARYGSGARRIAQRVAEALNRRFVGEVWHEMVRVIAPLDAALINLGRDITGLPGLPPGTGTHLQRARDRVRMITDVLDNLRALTAEVPSDFVVVEAAILLREAEELARATVDRPAGGLVVRTEVDTTLRLEADRSRLLQALTNLMVNAVEACAGLHRLAELRITAHRQANDTALITITDNGCGMNAEAVRDALLPYSTSKPAGMGFGLPLAKKIIEADHRGTLLIRSRPGEGTVASVVLPLVQHRDDD